MSPLLANASTQAFCVVRRARCRYVVTSAAPDGLGFRATSWLTALNVGLNQVELALPTSGIVRYRISYARWAAYALALGCALGLVLITFFLAFDLRAYIARHPGPQYLGLSANQGVMLAWVMAVFWGFVWPWMLIALHRRPLRRLMERLIAEVDADARKEPVRT